MQKNKERKKKRKLLNFRLFSRVTRIKWSNGKRTSWPNGMGTSPEERKGRRRDRLSRLKYIIKGGLIELSRKAETEASRWFGDPSAKEFCIKRFAAVDSGALRTNSRSLLRLTNMISRVARFPLVAPTSPFLCPLASSLFKVEPGLLILLFHWSDIAPHSDNETTTLVSLY